MASTATSPDALTQATAKYLALAVGDACIILLADSTGQTLTPAAFSHPDDVAMGLLAKVFASGSGAVPILPEGSADQIFSLNPTTALVIESFPLEALRHQIPDVYVPFIDKFEITDLLIMPLNSHGQMIGVLALGRNNDRKYSDNDRILVEELGSRVSLAIASSRLYAQLQTSENQLRLMFESSAVGMIEMDLKGKLVRVNRAYCTIVDRTEANLLGTAAADLRHPEEASDPRSVVDEVLKTGVSESEKRCLRPDGSTVWLHITANLHSENGEPVGIFAQVMDITERKRQQREQELQTTRSERLADFLRDLNEAGVEFDSVVEAVTNHVGSRYADACLVFFDRPQDDAFDLVGIAHRHVVAEEKLRNVFAARPLLHGQGVGADVFKSQLPRLTSVLDPSELRNREDLHEIADEYPMRSSVTLPLVVRNRAIGFLILGRSDATDPFEPSDLQFLMEIANRLATALDTADQYRGRISAELALRESQAQLRKMNIELAQQALHDPLTGLPNRLLLMDRLKHGLSQLRRSGKSLAVLYIDLDKFKSVNDTFGHAMGDALLVEVGARVQAVLRPADTVARIGGDEFVVICTEIDSVTNVTEIAHRIVVSMAEPFEVDDYELAVSAAVGYVIAHAPNEDPTELIHQADTAMFQAKKTGLPMGVDAGIL